MSSCGFSSGNSGAISGLKLGASSSTTKTK
jgi:hypothetical protein